MWQMIARLATSPSAASVRVMAPRRLHWMSCNDGPQRPELPVYVMALICDITGCKFGPFATDSWEIPPFTVWSCWRINFHACRLMEKYRYWPSRSHLPPRLTQQCFWASAAQPDPTLPFENSTTGAHSSGGGGCASHRTARPYALGASGGPDQPAADLWTDAAMSERHTARHTDVRRAYRPIAGWYLDCSGPGPVPEDPQLIGTWPGLACRPPPPAASAAANVRWKVSATCVDVWGRVLHLENVVGIFLEPFVSESSIKYASVCVSETILALSLSFRVKIR